MTKPSTHRAHRKQAVAAFFAALIFGAGLALSGMSNPSKVLNFLDLAGDWDPSLALVMASAIAVYAPIWHWIKGRHRPFLAESLALPSKMHLDRDLMLGSALFGVGWGLAGICPGAMFAALGLGKPDLWVFFLALIGGSALYQILHERGT